MSRLYGSMDADASKTTATKRAHRSISAHIRGWNSGVEVVGSVDGEDRDTFYVYATRGSNGYSGHRLIAKIVGDEVTTLVRDENGVREFTSIAS